METNQTNSPKKKPLSTNPYLRYATIGTQMLVIIGLGAYGGYKLDHYIRLKFPLFALLLTFVAVAAAALLSIQHLFSRVISCVLLLLSFSFISPSPFLK